jgi:hypothetical protein
MGYHCYYQLVTRLFHLLITPSADAKRMMKTSRAKKESEYNFCKCKIVWDYFVLFENLKLKRPLLSFSLFIFIIDMVDLVIFLMVSIVLSVFKEVPFHHIKRHKIYYTL